MSYLTFDNNLNEDLKTVAHNLWSSNLTGYHALNYKGAAHAAGAIGGVAGVYHQVKQANKIRDALGPLGQAFIPKAVMHPAVPITAALRIGSSLIGGKDMIDRKYFTSHFELPDSLKQQIAGWCKKAGATAFKKQNVGIGFKTLNLRQDGHELGNIHTRLATRALGNGALTTSTTCIPISAGKELFYYVYPTFDSSEIFDIKALKQKGKNDFEVIKLNQWKKEDSSKYRKD